VILKVDKPESDNNKIAEIRIFVPGKDLFVTKQADTFEQAVADGVDTLKIQIEKYKNA
jgi:ribosome-associated translation inhibitor RaiA